MSLVINKKTKRIIYVCAITYFFGLYLMVSVGTPICFDDCLGYIGLMGLDFDSDYLTKLKETWRPWFTPVFFSMFGPYNNATGLRIVVAQSVIAFLSWLVLAVSISLECRAKHGWIIVPIILLSCFSKQNYIYNHYLLSDSISTSSCLLLMSTIFWIRSRRESTEWLSELAFIFLSAIAVGVRDSNISIVFALWLIAVMHTAVYRKKPQIFLMMISIPIIIAMQVDGASFRRLTNNSNIMAGFVAPTDEVREYFIERGWRDRDLGQHKLEAQPWCGADYIRIMTNAALLNMDEKELRKASVTYYIWLISHPSYVIQQGWKDRQCIIGQSFLSPNNSVWASLAQPTMDAEIIRPGSRVATIQQGASIAGPLDKVPTDAKIFAIPLLFLASALVFTRNKNVNLMRGTLISLLGASNAIACYFSDLWEPSEMLRHAIMGATLFDLGIVVSMIDLIFIYKRRIE